MIRILFSSALGLFSLVSLSAAAINFDSPAANDLKMELAGLEPGIPTASPMPSGMAGENVLIPAKIIQLRVEQNSVNLADYSARMSVRCSYKAGLWQQVHSCGDREVPVEINALGQLLIPGIEAFDAHNGGDIKNFSMSVTLKKNWDDGDYLFSLSVRGKEGFNAYLSEKSAFRILKMNAATVEVLVEGRPLAGTDMSKNPRAALLSSIKSGESDGIMLVSPLTKLQYLDNLPHSYERESLADFKTLRLEAAVLIEKEGETRKLELATTLSLEDADGLDYVWQSRIEIQKTVDGLEKIRRVDLRKK